MRPIKGDYFSVPAVSNSLLGAYRRKLEGKPPMKSSRALAFGSGFHEIILEPENFDLYKYTGSERFRMMKMQEAVEEVITEEDREALKVGVKEREYFYPYLGLICKCKEDLRSVDHQVIIDLKTTGKTNESDFMQSVMDFGYYRQAAWYLDAPKAKEQGIERFVIYAITKEKEPSVFRFEIDKDSGLYHEGVNDYMELTTLMKKDKDYQHLLLEHSPIWEPA